MGEVDSIMNETEKAVNELIVEVALDKVAGAEGSASGVDIGALTSRWDYGSDGSRVGLLHQLKERVEEEKAEFLVVAGGIVNQYACRKTARIIREREKAVYDKLKLDLDQLNKDLKAVLHRLSRLVNNSRLIPIVQMQISNLRNLIHIQRERVKAAKPRSIGAILIEMTEEIAQQIHKDLPPIFRPDGKRMKIYVVTSWAYDREIGRNVVKRLIELRRDNENDIRYEASRHPENTTFKIPLKRSGRTFAVVVPNKLPWRSKYYSTAPDRYLEDESKRTTKDYCDVYAFGCGASSINRGKGEMPFQRISVPALHKLEDVKTAENVVGIRIVKFVPGKENCPTKTISMKSLVSDEGRFVEIPPRLTKVQIAIVEKIKSNSPSEASIGMLEDDLGVSRDKIEKALKGLLKIRQKVIGFDEDSQKYYLTEEFLKKHLRYSWSNDLRKEVLAGFACLHTGSRHTDYNYFVKEMPQVLFENDVTHLLGVGDFIQGLKHELQLQDEIIAGLNDYTSQEEACGCMIASVMLKVFSLRLERVLTGLSQKDISALVLDSGSSEAFVRDFLMDFLFWIGNHDEWSRAQGFVPLKIMQRTLWDALYRGTSDMFKSKGLPRVVNLAEILDEKIHRIENDTYYTMPSGLKLGGRHYYAGRTATSTTWCQRALHQFQSHLCWVANFHVEESVEEWSAKWGLRVVMQVPTLMTMSKFESNKGKVVDFGFGLMKVWSHQGKVVSSETNFMGVNSHKSFDNNQITRNLLETIGVGEFIDLSKIVK